MEPSELMDRIRSRPDFDKAGMVLCHQGVVRGTARDGRRVSGLRVHVDHGRLEEVLDAHRRLPGILDIQIHINEEKDLTVGDTVMVLAVAGDFRENVISALEKTLNAVKTTVTRKTEYFR
ncbi:MAG: molybdenum cofactor biosynthesis protein MoaE [Desulfobacterales bacterium]